MKPLFIFDKDDQLLTIAGQGLSYREAPHTEQLNKDDFFQFWVPADHPDAEYVKEENQVAFQDEDGEFRLFVIKELDEAHDELIYKEAYCRAAWMDELSDEPLEDLRPQDKTAAQALTTALQNARWQVGNVAELGLNSTNFYYESVLSAIQKILNVWGGEIKDRITVVDNQITGRYIDILARRGADTGRRFERTKDLQSIRRTVLSYPKTAMYGRGKGEEVGDGYGRRITFADIEWSVANGDPADKPLGQSWIGDPDAKAQFGRPNADGTRRHRFGFSEFPDVEDPTELLHLTWTDLQQKKMPLVNYEGKAVDLEHIPGFDHEKVRLGDTTFIVDHDFSPPLLVEVRAIGIKRYLNEPERTEITWGNFLPYLSDEKRLDQVEAKLNDKSGIWDSGGGPIDDTDYPDTVPPTPTNLMAMGNFKAIMLKWDFDPSSYIAAYEVYGSQVADFTPDTSNLLYRGKAGGFVHNAAINEEWYFRVRAINTHGTPSAFTNQVSAATVQIKAEDIMPYVITNLLIAEDAEIDFAKIANVIITNAHISNFSWDKGEGGVIYIGGLENGDGELVIRNEVGEAIANYNKNGGYVKNLAVENFVSSQVVYVNRDTLYFYVDPLYGDDNNSGKDWANAKKTVMSVVETLPKYNMGLITIYGHYENGDNFNENIHLESFHGQGDIVLDFQTTNNKLNGYVYLRGNTNFISIRNVTMSTTDARNSAVEADRCSLVDLRYVKVYGNNLTPYGFLAIGAKVMMYNCDIYNVTYDGIRSGHLGEIWFQNCAGLAGSSGLVAVDGGVIRGNGHAPGGSSYDIYETRGGDVVGTFTVNLGAATPPPAPDTTQEFTADSGMNWDVGGNFWDSYDLFPRQGNYGYGRKSGFWFFGTKLDVLVGKTIKSMSVYVKRKASGGVYDPAPIQIRWHAHKSKPTTPADEDQSSEYVQVNLNAGDYAWVTIPSSWFGYFTNGSAKGIGCYIASDAKTDYANLEVGAKIKVTYS